MTLPLILLLSALAQPLPLPPVDVRTCTWSLGCKMHAVYCLLCLRVSIGHWAICYRVHVLTLLCAVRPSVSATLVLRYGREGQFHLTHPQPQH